MLPAMTAAILLRPRVTGSRASGVAVAVATLAKQTGAATLLPGAVPRVAGPGPPGRGRRGGRASRSRSRSSRCSSGPAQLLFWAVLGNGSYLGIGSASLYVLGLFAVMTVAFVLCNLPIVVPAASARGAAAHDRDDDRPLAVAALGRAVGRRRVPVLRPLLPAAAPAAVPPLGGGARPGIGACPGRDRRRARRASRSASRCSGTSRSRSAVSRSTRRSAGSSRATRRPRTASSSGARSPRSTGRRTGARRPGSRATRSSPATGAAGPRATSRAISRRPDALDLFLDDFGDASAALRRSTRRRPGSATRSTTRCRSSRRSRRSSARTTTTCARSTASRSTSATPTRRLRRPS